MLGSYRTMLGGNIPGGFQGVTIQLVKKHALTPRCMVKECNVPLDIHSVKGSALFFEFSSKDVPKLASRQSGDFGVNRHDSEWLGSANGR